MHMLQEPLGALSRFSLTLVCRCTLSLHSNVFAGAELKPIMEMYAHSEDLRRCHNCGELDLLPERQTE